MVKILVISTVSPTKLLEAAKISIETHLAYPAGMKKLIDAGANYIKYTIYEIEDSKLKEGLEFVGKRYHRIASHIEGFDFKAQVLMDDVDMAKMIMEEGEKPKKPK